MDELEIKKHDFQKAKNEIQQFSRKKPEELGLPETKEWGGLFGLVEHKVTGIELNELVNQIEKYLISYNETIGDLVKEFGQIYTALDALDRDYIDAILVAFQRAQEAHKQTHINQKDITNTITEQQKTLKVLKKFHDRLAKVEHLEKVDALWDEVQLSQKHVKQLGDQIDTLIEKGTALKGQLEALCDFQERLSTQAHIEDVDEMWNELQGAQAMLEEQKESIEQFRGDISTQAELIESEKANSASQMEALERKIWLAYTVAGGAIFLFLTQILLGILGVL